MAIDQNFLTYLLGLQQSGGNAIDADGNITPYAMNLLGNLESSAGQYGGYFDDPEADEQKGRVDDLLNQMETARTDALAANEDRYNQILGGYNDRSTALQGMYGDLQDQATGLLQQSRSDLGERYDQVQANTDMELQRRGLGNTTALVNANRGVAESESRDMARLDEAYLGQQLNQGNAAAAAFGQYSMDPLQFMAQRQDVGPSMADVANLSMGYGQAAGMDPGMFTSGMYGMLGQQAPNYSPQGYAGGGGGFMDSLMNVGTFGLANPGAFNKTGSKISDWYQKAFL